MMIIPLSINKGFYMKYLYTIAWAISGIIWIVGSYYWFLAKRLKMCVLYIILGCLNLVISLMFLYLHT